MRPKVYADEDGTCSKGVNSGEKVKLVELVWRGLLG